MTVREPERELPTNAPTPHIEDEDALQTAEWDSEYSNEDSSSDWEDTEEGRTLSATQSLMCDATWNHYDSEIDGLPNMIGPTVSTAEQSNAPHSRAPSAPVPSPRESNEVGVDDRQHVWLSSPGPVNSRMSSENTQPDWNFEDPSVPPNAQQEISSTDRPSFSCSRQPRRNEAFREIHEIPGLSPVAPEPITSTRPPVWTHATNSHASAGQLAAAGRVMQQCNQPAPEADMSITTIPQPSATAAAQQNWEPIRIPGRDTLGRFTTEVIEVMGPFSVGTAGSRVALKYEG